MIPTRSRPTTFRPDEKRSFVLARDALWLQRRGFLWSLSVRPFSPCVALSFCSASRKHRVGTCAELWAEPLPGRPQPRGPALEIFAYDGGGGTDTIDFSQLTTDLSIDLHNSNAGIAVGGTADTIKHFENVIGASGADVVTAAAPTASFIGAAGVDTLVFTTLSQIKNGPVRDTFIDFLPGEDKINLNAVDGSTVQGGSSISPSTRRRPNGTERAMSSRPARGPALRPPRTRSAITTRC
jgi:hypothetical protein